MGGCSTPADGAVVAETAHSGHSQNHARFVEQHRIHTLVGSAGGSYLERDMQADAVVGDRAHRERCIRGYSMKNQEVARCRSQGLADMKRPSTKVGRRALAGRVVALESRCNSFEGRWAAA